MPRLVSAYLKTLGMELAAFLHEPDLGVPVGMFLHLLSLLSQVMLPDSSFSLRSAQTQHYRSSRLFAGAKHASDARGARGYTNHLGKMIMAQRTAALQYTVRSQC